VDIADIPVIPAPLPLVRRSPLVPPAEPLFQQRAAAALPAALRPLVPGRVRDIQPVEQHLENIPHMCILDRPADWYILDRLDNWRRFQVAALEWRLPAEVLVPRSPVEAQAHLMGQ
jgi:hypothetical protein